MQSPQSVFPVPSPCESHQWSSTERVCEEENIRFSSGLCARLAVLFCSSVVGFSSGVPMSWTVGQRRADVSHFKDGENFSVVRWGVMLVLMKPLFSSSTTSLCWCVDLECFCEVFPPSVSLSRLFLSLSLSLVSLSFTSRVRKQNGKFENCSPQQSGKLQVTKRTNYTDPVHNKDGIISP